MSKTIGYAYLDKYGLMHVASNENDAKNYARFSGKVKKYEGEFAQGYPLYEGEEVTISIKDGKASAILGVHKPLRKDVEAAFVDFALGLV